MNFPYRIVACAFLVAVNAACGGPSTDAGRATALLPVISDHELTPRWLSEQELTDEGRRKFPEFELTDQAGRSLKRADLEGHVVVANFFFTGCSTLCPRLRGAMAKVRDAYAGADDVRLLSHSVTPELDSPRVLATYAKANAVDGEQWRLLTGQRETLDRLTHEGYLVPKSRPGEGSVLHTEWLILLDQQQRVRGIYNGTLPIEVGWLIRDVQLLREQTRS